MHRIFMNPQSLKQPEILFEGEAFQHLFKACRVEVSEKVGVLDGLGSMAIVEIKQVEKNRARGTIRSTEKVNSELPIQVDLAQAIGKKDKFEEVIDKATQLGVSNIIPLITERTIVKAKDWSSKQERWQKIALEAAQQSGRGIIPQCLAPIQIKDIKKSDYDAIFILSQKGKPFSNFKEKYSKVLILVGPEGDFTDSELATLQSLGGQLTSLGPRIYRTEVAGLVALSIFNYAATDGSHK